MKRLVSLLLLLSAVAVASAQDIEVPAYEPLSYNTDQRVNGDGSFTAEISGGWRNYMNQSDKWEKIDTKIRKDGNNWVADKLPFTFQAPEYADGDAYFESTNRFDIQTKSKIDAAPIGMWMKSLDAKHVKGKPYTMDGTPSAVIYEDAFPGADLIYYVHLANAPQLEKLVRFKVAPQSDTDFRFLLTFSKDPKMKAEGAKWNKSQKNIRDGGVAFSDKDDSRRAVGFKPAGIWDSAIKAIDQKKARIDVTIKSVAGGVVYTKHIPEEFFTNAVLPVFTDATATFYPDPNTETTSVDGQVGRDGNDLGTGVDWSADYVNWDGTGAGGGSNDSGTSVEIRAKGYPVEYGITRGFFLFDTSSLGATASISDAVLSLYVNSKLSGENNGQDSINIFSSAPASNTAIAQADFNDVGSTAFATAIDISSNITTSAYNAFTFNASGIADISLAGVSKFSGRIGSDYNNTAITHVGQPQNSISIASADTANTTSDPKLVVTYTLVTPSTNRGRMIQIMMNLLIPSVYAH